MDITQTGLTADDLRNVRAGRRSRRASARRAPTQRARSPSCTAQPPTPATRDAGSRRCEKQLAGLDARDAEQARRRSIPRSLTVGAALSYLGMMIREKAYADHRYTPAQQAERDGFGMLDLPQVIAAYKPRPLAGIWASPRRSSTTARCRRSTTCSRPSPIARRRSASAAASSTPVKLGLAPEVGSVLGLDTTKDGNHNTGHEFSARLQGVEGGRPARTGPHRAAALARGSAGDHRAPEGAQRRSRWRSGAARSCVPVRACAIPPPGPKPRTPVAATDRAPPNDTGSAPPTRRHYRGVTRWRRSSWRSAACPRSTIRRRAILTRVCAPSTRAFISSSGPSALCLSGGGIRSATFALGVLQGLAHARCPATHRLSLDRVRRRLHRRVAHGLAASRRSRGPRRRDARAGSRHRRAGRRHRRSVAGRPRAPHLPLPRAKRRHCLGRRLDARHDDGEESGAQLAGASCRCSRRRCSCRACITRRSTPSKPRRRVAACSTWQHLAGPPMWFLVVVARIGFLIASGVHRAEFRGPRRAMVAGALPRASS